MLLLKIPIDGLFATTRDRNDGSAICLHNGKREDTYRESVLNGSHLSVCFSIVAFHCEPQVSIRIDISGEVCGVRVVQRERFVLHPGNVPSSLYPDLRGGRGVSCAGGHQRVDMYLIAESRTWRYAGSGWMGLSSGVAIKQGPAFPDRCPRWRP